VSEATTPVQGSAPQAAGSSQAAQSPQGKASNSGPIVWIDCEMTGLDNTKDALVEIACIVTDADLNELDQGVSLVVAPPASALENMGDFVENMHRESGLLPEITGGVSAAEAESAVLEYVKAHVPQPGKAPLAGSSVHVDRLFLAREMPELDGYLHYRIVDVSSIKELSKRWYPKAYFTSPTKTGNHRALGDIRDSIAELRHYRRTVFQPATTGDSAAE